MHRKNGIIVFNLIFFLFGFLFPSREVELQFHEVREEYKINFDKLEKIGVSKIIVRTFVNNNKKGGLLFDNSNFRMIYPAFDKIIKRNKQRNYELWGWLVSRRYDWMRNNNFYDTAFRKGKRIKIKKIDLFNKKAVELVVNLFGELAKKGINGILIQDDYVIKTDEGFSRNGMKIFSSSAFVPAKEKLMMESGTPYNLKWIKIKEKIIKDYISSIVKKCKTIDTEIKIGINLYYESSIFPKKSSEWYSINIEGIAETDIDRIYLMMYHRQMKRELKYKSKVIKELFREGIENALKIVGNRLVVKMETYDWKKRELIPINEMKEYIKLIPSAANKVCFTPVKNADIKYLKGLVDAANN